MSWLERFGCALFGFLLASLLQWSNGHLEVSGDFAANVGGAAIGGMISVGLAVVMFNHERKIAQRDRALDAQTQRSEAIRQSLRHIRAIKECILGAGAITINSFERISTSISKASQLTTAALEDQNLTDFPLRVSMGDAAQIGHTTVAALQSAMAQAGLQDANTPLPAAQEICETAIDSLNQLIANYTEIRKVPAV
jgi:hypothetical protein